MNLSLSNILIGAIMLLTIMPVHEYAHAWAADKLGDGSARLSGRMTLNPFAHLDLVGSISFLLVGIGWGKPVPVYMRNLNHPKRDMMLVALAGPASNVVLTILLMIVYKVLSAIVVAAGIQNYIINILLWVILMIAQTSARWAVFNMLPVPPLDGSRLLEYLLPWQAYAKIEQYQQIIYIVMLVLLVTGVLSVPLSFLTNLLLKLVSLITLPVDLLLGVLF